jgi:AraC-like DNA-binding protein
MHQLSLGAVNPQAPPSATAAPPTAELRRQAEVAVMLPPGMAGVPRAAAGVRLLRVASVRELRALTASTRLAGLISTARDEFGVPVQTLAEGASPLPHDAHLTLFGRLSPDMSEQALQLTAAGYRVRVALDGFEAPGTALRDAVDRSLPSDAQLRLLGALTGVARPALAHVLVGAAVVGARRPSVATLCDATGVARRTLERRLKDGRLPPAHRLLLDVLVLHVLWQTELLGWPLKRVAARAGFASPAALRDCVRRHCGAPLRRTAGGGGFDAGLAGFTAKLREAGLLDREAGR